MIEVAGQEPDLGRAGLCTMLRKPLYPYFACGARAEALAIFSPREWVGHRLLFGQIFNDAEGQTFLLFSLDVYHVFSQMANGHYLTDRGLISFSKYPREPLRFVERAPASSIYCIYMCVKCACATLREWAILNRIYSYLKTWIFVEMEIEDNLTGRQLVYVWSYLLTALVVQSNICTSP